MVRYTKFRIGDLFEKLEVPYYGKGARHSDISDIRTDEYCVPVTTAKKGNNGICRWARKGQFKTYENVISIVYNGAIAAGLTYYQPDAVAVLTDSYFIRLKDGNLNEQVGLYLACAIQKIAKAKYSRENKAVWKRVSDDLIALPTTDDGKPDYEYMAERISELEAERISELEAERISELEAYLITAGLNDYELTDDDKKVLSLSSIRPLDEVGHHVVPGVVRKEMREFRVAKLFDGKTGDVDLQTRDIDGKGEYYVNSGVQNQGIKGRTSRPARTFPAGTITVDFFGNAYLRDFEFKMATHNHVFALIEKVSIPHDAKLYITGALGKLAGLYSFNNMLTWTILKDVMISLPVDESDEPDFEYMAAYIRVQEKLAIADAVKLKDRIIAETAKLVLGNDAGNTEVEGREALGQAVTDGAAVVHDAQNIRGLHSTCFRVTGIDEVRNQVVKVHHLDEMQIGDAVRHVDVGGGKVIDLTSETITIRVGGGVDYTFTYPDVFAAGLMERA